MSSSNSPFFCLLKGENIKLLIIWCLNCILLPIEVVIFFSLYKHLKVITRQMYSRNFL
jgi:hypothetical protein